MSRSYSDRLFQPIIFVNYRRSDSSGESALLAERLLVTYGKGRVFFDVRAITAGTDYERALEKARLSAQAMLAVIGPDWINATNGDGRRRLELDDDPVRIEIQAALNKGARIIPVLVKGSSMPTAEDLPETIKQIATIQAHRIDHETFDRDFQGLKLQLDSILTSQRSSRTAGSRGTNHISTGGTVAATGGIYVERELDFRLLRLISAEAKKVIICGPRQAGKSSLLVRVAEQAQTEGREVAIIDLTRMGVGITFTQFLAGLASEITEQLDIPLVLDLFNSHPLESFIELLAMLPRESVIIFDEVEVIYQYSFSQLALDVFSAIMTAPSISGQGCCLILSGTFITDDIPFLNLAEPPELFLVTNYDAFQSRLFFERARVALSDDEFQTLYELTGGQPYLVAVSAHKLRSGITLDELTDSALDIDGPFDIHLRWLMDLLKRQQSLLDSLCKFINGKKLSESATNQLLYAGFLKKTGFLQEKRPQLELACGLYKKLLAELCKQSRVSLGRRLLNRGG
jgi:hypothetical protein